MLQLQIYELEGALSHDDKPAEINRIIAWWSEYIDYFNCLYLLLESAYLKEENIGYFEIAEITKRDIFRITYEDGNFSGCSIADLSVTSIYQMAHFGNYFNLPFQYQNRMIISETVFAGLANNLETIIQQKYLVHMLSGITKALSEYKIGNYTTSLTLSWFIIESILSRKWTTFLTSKDQIYSDNCQRINRDRKNYLTNGTDFTICAITNILELTDFLPFTLYKKIDTVRGYRNKIVHQNQNYKCEPEHCVMALEIVKELLLEDTGIDIFLNLSISISGA
jgi:hypothetical protein